MVDIGIKIFYVLVIYKEERILQKNGMEWWLVEMGRGRGRRNMQMFKKEY